MSFASTVMLCIDVQTLCAAYIIVHMQTYIFIHSHTCIYICTCTTPSYAHTHTLCLAHAGDEGHDHAGDGGHGDTGDSGGGHGHGSHGDSGYAWHVHNLPVDQTLDPAVQCLSSWVGPHYDPFNARSVANYSTTCTPSTPAM